MAVANTATSATSNGKICFLSMENVGEQYETDDHLAVEPLAKLGWKVEFHPWRSASVDWSQFHCVILRSTWDYHQTPEEFVKVLQDISKVTRLENPLEIVQWNLNKQTYLQDLQAKGVSIVPTIFSSEPVTPALVDQWFQDYEDAQELIIKPTIGASASDTYRIQRTDTQTTTKMSSLFDGTRAYMVQPFIEAIVTEGEYSLFYMGKGRHQFSHATLKTPQKGDFRVQEEYGGNNVLLQEPDEALLAAGNKALQAIGRNLLYARVDLVRWKDQFVLMELELIEPSLYMRLDPAAPQRFA